MKPTIPVVADVHHASTGRTDAVNDVEFPQREIGIRRPFVRHPADLHVLVRSIDSKGTTKGYTRKPSPSSSLSGHCFYSYPITNRKLHWSAATCHHSSRWYRA